MKFLKLEVPKAKLDTLPEDDLILFIQLGNVLNEINILEKCTILSGMGIQHLNEVERSGQVSQALFFIKMLAGKLFEGKRLLETPFLGKHKDKLSEAGQKSLKKLNRYFSKTNIIDFIRNKFAFHYDQNVIKSEFRKRPSDEVLDIFLSPEVVNCLYSFSDVIANFAILNAVNPNDNLQGMDSLIKEIVSDVAGWFEKVAGECLAIISLKAGLDPPKLVEIQDPPSINDFRLRYFLMNK